MLLKIGDIGLDVNTLQRKLFSSGIKVTIDGHYGAKTEAAVKQLQKRFGLVEDGIYGPKTATVLNEQSSTKLLKQKDIITVAKELNVDVATVLAINEVESVGMGFLPDGRPKILFERHIFYKLLAQKKRHNLRELTQKYPNIVASTMGGYVGNHGEYARLSVASSIDDELALEACSWGLFQIMGYHWERLGYKSIKDFVEQMKQSEANQLEAFKRYILSDEKLLVALQKQDWVTFARLYNGPAYKRNLYDVKIARAYDRFVGKDND